VDRKKRAKSTESRFGTSCVAAEGIAVEPSLTHTLHAFSLISIRGETTFLRTWRAFHCEEAS
jgi:hypothetical protein